ncbi:unnamed protein product, partial [Ectocarpus fasciculatus]
MRMDSSPRVGCCPPRLLQQRRQEQEVLPPTALREPLRKVSSGPAMAGKPAHRRSARRAWKAGTWRLPAAYCMLGLLA